MKIIKETYNQLVENSSLIDSQVDVGEKRTPKKLDKEKLRKSC